MGTWLGRAALGRLSGAQFQRWSTALVVAMALVLLGNALRMSLAA